MIHNTMHGRFSVLVRNGTLEEELILVQFPNQINLGAFQTFLTEVMDLVLCEWDGYKIIP